MAKGKTDKAQLAPPTQDEQLSKLEDLVMQQGSMIATLQKENAQLKEDNDKLKKQLADFTGSEPTAKTEVRLTKPTVKVAGEEYIFRVPKFSFKEKTYTAEAAATDEALLSAIIDMPNQGILKLIAK